MNYIKKEAALARAQKLDIKLLNTKNLDIITVYNLLGS